MATLKAEQRECHQNHHRRQRRNRNRHQRSHRQRNPRRSPRNRSQQSQRRQRRRNHRRNLRPKPDRQSPGELLAMARDRDGRHAAIPLRRRRALTRVTKHTRTEPQKGSGRKQRPAATSAQYRHRRTRPGGRSANVTSACSAKRTSPELFVTIGLTCIAD